MWYETINFFDNYYKSKMLVYGVVGVTESNDLFKSKLTFFWGLCTVD